MWISVNKRKKTNTKIKKKYSNKRWKEAKPKRRLRVIVKKLAKIFPEGERKCHKKIKWDEHFSFSIYYGIVQIINYLKKSSFFVRWWCPIWFYVNSTQARVIWKRETQLSKCSHLISLWESQCLFVSFDDWCRSGQLIVGVCTPGLVVLNAIRKQAEQALKS